MKASCLVLSLLILSVAMAQMEESRIATFLAKDSIKVTIDKNSDFSARNKTIITFYALPNGNTTEQTMGKKIREGDDWHFDIQHIRAQTEFIRSQLPGMNFIVIYLENNYKSWPAWKRAHPDFTMIIPHLIDSLSGLIPGRHKDIYLNGHSGGGSFIFGYIAAVSKIPPIIKRISFLDSNYGYDSSYYPKIKNWLDHVKGSSLNVFAYNDSVALLHGKPFVSPTGGTWYRSHLFLKHLQIDFLFQKIRDDSLVVYISSNKNIQLFFKTNPGRKILHTTQVELNGFIHSVLCGTFSDSKKYTYYGNRAYNTWIE